MRRALAVFASALAAVAAAAPSALAQGSQDGSVLLILDSSKSMNDPAGASGTRLDAAKAAVRELVDALPPQAQVGVRVYGAKVEESGRTAGCRDTELVVPVGPLDKAGLRDTVDGLRGKGRTPIGRSLLAAPDDLPAGGRRTVILVSDGGDNCAPPDPCRAAAEVAKQGVEMTIQVVGLQVNERVRRQLKCIADAGGGTYVDARDPGALTKELLAAFARAFRVYEPTGTPVDGGPAIDSAVTIGPGQYLDEFAPLDEERWYRVDLARGERLVVAATAVPPDGLTGSGRFAVELADAEGDFEDSDSMGFAPRQDFSLSDIDSVSVVSGLAGSKDEFPEGTARFKVVLDGNFSVDLPIEIAVGVLGPGDRPRFGQAGARPGKTETPAATATPKPEPEVAEDGGGNGALAIAGGGGLLAGLLGGFAAARSRRRS